MIGRLREQEGWSVVTAVIAMAIIFALGLGALSFVDSQTRQSGRERIHESSFNLSEGVLSAQAFLLSSNWPGTPAAAFPAACTPADGGAPCPSEATLDDSFDEPDYVGTDWRTEIRDDRRAELDAGGACVASDPQSIDTFYSEAVSACNPTYDANGNEEMWVRSEATVGGARRALVARVRVPEVQEQFPKQLATAGKIAMANNGNKTIADRNGLQNQWGTEPNGPGRVRVRCLNANDPGCVSANKARQISPCCVETGQPGRTYGSPGAVARLRNKARALGSYYETCPASLPSPESRIIFIESGDCSYRSNTDVFAETAPGLLVIADGTIRLEGTMIFYGIVYAANLQGSTAAGVMQIVGSAQVQGAAAVDDEGGMLLGESKENLVWDPRVFSDPVALQSFGSAGVLKNTFRELPTN